MGGGRIAMDRTLWSLVKPAGMLHVLVGMAVIVVVRMRVRTVLMRVVRMIVVVRVRMVVFVCGHVCLLRWNTLALE